MTAIQPSRETMARTVTQVRDILDLARKVSISESDWGLYQIAATLLRDAGEIAPSYRVLSLTAGLVRWIRGRQPRVGGPGRCPRCSYHVPTQGHCTVCCGDQQQPRRRHPE
jgi:hypothetical protein